MDNLDKELKELIRNSGGIIGRVDEDENPYQYKTRGSGKSKITQIPHSSGSGGVGNDPYGDVSPTPIYTADPVTGAFVPTGEMHIPDSVKYRNKNPWFLEQKAKERELNRQQVKSMEQIPGKPVETEIKEEKPELMDQFKKTLLHKGVSEELVDKLAQELAENQTDKPIEEHEPQLEEPEVTLEGKIPETSQEQPVEAQPIFTEVSETEFANASSPEDTEIPSKLFSSIEEEKSEIKVSFSTKAGTFKTRYHSVTDLPQFVVCTYNREQDLFTPAISQDQDDFITLSTDNTSYDIFNTGNEMDIPDTELALIIFIKKQG